MCTLLAPNPPSPPAPSKVPSVLSPPSQSALSPDDSPTPPTLHSLPSVMPPPIHILFLLSTVVLLVHGESFLESLPFQWQKRIFCPFFQKMNLTFQSAGSLPTPPSTSPLFIPHRWVHKSDGKEAKIVTDICIRKKNRIKKEKR